MSLSVKQMEQEINTLAVGLRVTFSHATRADVYILEAPERYAFKNNFSRRCYFGYNLDSTSANYKIGRTKLQTLGRVLSILEEGIYPTY